MHYECVIAALADPTRRSILEGLRGREASVAEIAAPLPVSRPAVSQHLRVLSDAGLLDVRRDGTRRLYRLSPRGISDLRAWLDTMWSDALQSFAAEAEARHTAKTRRGNASKTKDTPE
ncbi:MAG: metalloregulator ArsR/SmtB family transcription factor [Pseudomonadota bacterium]